MAVLMSLTALGIVVFAAGRVDAENEVTPVDVASPGPLETRAEPPYISAREVRPPAALASPEPARQRRALDHLWPDRGFRIVRVKRDSRVRLHERPRGPIVDTVGARSEFGSAQVFSVLGRRGRWLEVTAAASPDNRPVWLRANRGTQRFETTNLSLHADLSERRLELRRGDRVLRRFTVTIGAPSTATPRGRFSVTDVIVDGLNPVYGCCAIALSAHQPDLPPGWIGGDRVALHGTVGQVGTASSIGCLRGSNEDVGALSKIVPLGAPVFVRG